MHKERRWLPAINGWRGILAFCILMLHFDGIYWGNQIKFATGYLAVDGFFVISGFFLFLSLEKKSVEEISIAKELQKKIYKLYPIYLICIAILLISYCLIPEIRLFEFSLQSIFAEIFMLQMSGIFETGLVNFVDWYISALMFAIFIYIALYKINKKLLIQFILPICVISCYAVCYSHNNNLDIHYHFKALGFIWGGMLRALGGIAVGGICFYATKKIELYMQATNKLYKSWINAVEIISAIFVIRLLYGRSGNTLDYIFPFAFGVSLVCAYFGIGLISKLLSAKVLQKIGYFSMEIFLTQSIVIYFFCAFVPRNLEKRVIVTLVFWVIEIGLSAFMYYFVQKKGYISFYNKLKQLRVYSNKEIVIWVFVVILIFSLQGTNIWAETVAEYQKYAEGALIEESFAGYLTIFPILMGYVYHYLLSWSSISWYIFCTAISCMYTILSVVSILIICKRKNICKVDASCILLALVALIAHPSVSSLINITHLGYIPVVLYIVLSVFDGTLTDGMNKLPNIAILPLLLAVISKPSFFCLVFMLVAVGTKTYKRPFVFASLVGSSILSAIQLLMFGGENIAFRLGNLKGIVKFAISFVEATGASIYFPIRYYIEGVVSIGTIIVSLLLGIFVVGSLLCFLWKEKNNIKAWIKTVVIFSIIAACIMPYLTLDYTQSWQNVQQQVFNLSFGKYKLQYQLTSSITMIAIFVQIIRVYTAQKYADKAVKQGLSICMVLALLNGVCCGLYSGHWQTVSVIEGEGISYTNKDNFKYAPNPDWDWSWSEDMGGWTKGSQYYGYRKKPETLGGVFREKNTETLPEIVDKNAKIYLMLSDPNMVGRNATNYWDLFNRPDSESSYTFGEYTVIFSEATDSAVRYAVVPYTREMAELLFKSEYLVMKNNDDNALPLEAEYLNFCIVW